MLCFGVPWRNFTGYLIGGIILHHTKKKCVSMNIKQSFYFHSETNGSVITNTQRNDMYLIEISWEIFQFYISYKFRTLIIIWGQEDLKHNLLQQILSS